MRTPKKWRGTTAQSPCTSTVNLGETRAINVHETTDVMPSINISIYYVNTASPVDWNVFTAGDRLYFTPNAYGAGHRYLVVVSTMETMADIADLHLYTYQNYFITFKNDAKHLVN